MFDFSNLPIPGTAIVAIAVYCTASGIAGQVVGARIIEKMNWVEFCESSIKDAFQAEIAQTERDNAVVPQTDCESLIGRWHPDLNRLCWEFNNPDLGGPDARAAREAERIQREVHARQLAQAASQAGSQCKCAAAVYRRRNMIGLGIYAGTARILTMPQISNMDSGLNQALGEPICASYTGGAS